MSATFLLVLLRDLHRQVAIGHCPVAPKRQQAVVSPEDELKSHLTDHDLTRL